MKITHRILTVAGLIAFMIATPVASQAQDKSDKAGVKMAALDYVEGIYEVQPERIERSVSKDLAKIGYCRPKDKTTYSESPMTYEQLVDLAGKWNKSGRVDADTAPKEIEILDMMDQTAVVKLSAQWGVDYLNIAKNYGRWMIMNILWQSYPPDSH